MYRKLVWASALLTLVVVVVGAYVRLSDAGLGCRIGRAVTAS
jgi:heme A synthase